MNYKYVISFLATKQQKQWAKPSSDWVVLHDGAWTQVAKELFPSSRYEAEFSGSIYQFNNRPGYVSLEFNTHTHLYTPNGGVYYNPVLKTGIFTYASRDMSEDFLKSLQEFCDAHPKDANIYADTIEDFKIKMKDFDSTGDMNYVNYK